LTHAMARKDPRPAPYICVPPKFSHPNPEPPPPWPKLFYVIKPQQARRILEFMAALKEAKPLNPAAPLQVPAPAPHFSHPIPSLPPLSGFLPRAFPNLGPRNSIQTKRQCPRGMPAIKVYLPQVLLLCLCCATLKEWNPLNLPTFDRTFDRTFPSFPPSQPHPPFPCLPLSLPVLSLFTCTETAPCPCLLPTLE
jgi:hypothetical protein